MDDPERRKAATGFWFAVQRMIRRKDSQPGDDTDEGAAGSRVPHDPVDPSDSAEAVPDDVRDPRSN